MALTRGRHCCRLSLVAVISHANVEVAFVTDIGTDLDVEAPFFATQRHRCKQARRGPWPGYTGPRREKNKASLWACGRAGQRVEDGPELLSPRP